MPPQLLSTRLTVPASAFVAPTAVLVGEVFLGEEASVWYGSVLRGDLAAVRVGERSNVQDGSILHVEHGVEVSLGSRVTVGHGAIVHAAHVEDDCLIAIGARVLSGARVGRGSIVAAGALVRENSEVPPGSLVVGVPGRVIRQVSPEETERVQENWRLYVEYAKVYRSGRMG